MSSLYTWNVEISFELSGALPAALQQHLTAEQYATLVSRVNPPLAELRELKKFDTSWRGSLDLTAVGQHSDAACRVRHGLPQIYADPRCTSRDDDIQCSLGSDLMSDVSLCCSIA